MIIEGQIRYKILDRIYIFNNYISKFLKYKALKLMERMLKLNYEIYLQSINYRTIYFLWEWF